MGNPIISNYQNVRRAFKSRVAVVITSYISEKDDYNLKALLFSIDNFMYFRPGVKFDLFVVDNHSTNENWLRVLDSGSLKVFHRKNLGFSFGGYKHVFDRLKNEYEYFLFCEHDVTPTKHNWLKEIFGIFFSRPDIGVVVNAITGGGYNRDIFPHMLRWSGIASDGLFYFTSTDILNRCGIVINDGASVKDFEGIENEMLFVQPILEYGYSMAGMIDTGGFTSSYSYCYGSAGENCALKSENPRVLEKSITPLITAHCITGEKLGHLFRNYFTYQTGKNYDNV